MVEENNNLPLNEEKKKLLVVGILSITSIALVTLITIIIYYLVIKPPKDSKEVDNSSDSYANLLNYLNTETKYKDNTKEIKTISAFTFKEGVIEVFAENDDYSMLYEIKTSFNDVTNALEALETTSFELGTYDIGIKQLDNESIAINASGNQSIGKVYSIHDHDPEDTNKYISYTAKYDDGTIGTVINENYNSLGNYSEIKTKEDNKVLYKFLSYLLAK